MRQPGHPIGWERAMTSFQRRMDALGLQANYSRELAAHLDDFRRAPHDGHLIFFDQPIPRRRTAVALTPNRWSPQAPGPTSRRPHQGIFRPRHHWISNHRNRHHLYFVVSSVAAVVSSLLVLVSTYS